MIYYTTETYLTTAKGNNALTFRERKKQNSDTILRIPPLVAWKVEDIVFDKKNICYEYVDENQKLITSYGLKSLVKIDFHDKDLYIVDNHNHAFAMWWRSFLAWKIQWWSKLIHIDQHSDLAEPEHYIDTSYEDINQQYVDLYTNDVLTIASFIKPAKKCGLICDYDMIMTEYKLLQVYNVTENSLIVDIDLDFWAPEMWIEQYEKTINQVRKLMFHPHVWCITIATSPTYIDQERALHVLKDLVEDIDLS